MFQQRSRLFFLTVIAVALVTPILIALRYPAAGGALLLVGVLIAWRNIRLLRHVSQDDDPAEQRRHTQARDQGRTIFVQLIDDQGNDLEEAACAAHLAAARRNAGLRDTVIGVRRKVA